MQNEKFLLEKSFTKKDLLQLCRIYNVNISSQKRIDAIVTELNKIIFQSDCIPCLDELQVEQSVTTQGRKSKIPQTESIPEMHVPDAEILGPSNLRAPSPNSSASEPAIQKSSKSTQPKKRKIVRHSKEKGKGRGKSSRKKYASLVEPGEYCVICNKPDIGSLDEGWISCDVCCLWYHRNCVNLQDDDLWASLSEEGAQYTCPMCK